MTPQEQFDNAVAVFTADQQKIEHLKMLLDKALDAAGYYRFVARKTADSAVLSQLHGNYFADVALDEGAKYLGKDMSSWNNF